MLIRSRMTSRPHHLKKTSSRNVAIYITRNYKRKNLVFIIHNQLSPLHNLKMVNPWMWTFMSGSFDENSTFSTLVYWTFSPGGGNSCYVSMKPTEWSFHVVLYIMLNKLVLILIGCGKERSVMVRWAGQWAATRKPSVCAPRSTGRPGKKGRRFFIFPSAPKVGYGCYSAGNTSSYLW